jgi:RNA polymerase sigma-70 factor (ECF subfamily)
MLHDDACFAMPNQEARNLRCAMAELLPTLRARAITLCRSRVDADDLLQETVLRALRFEATFQIGTNLRAWMNQVMQSVFISRCRSGARERLALQRFLRDPTLTSSSSPAPVLHLVSERMHAALQALAPQFRSTVELVDLREYSYREAAEELGVPVGTVMSRLFRARRILETALGEGQAADVAAVARRAIKSKSTPAPHASAKYPSEKAAVAGLAVAHAA